MTPEQFYEQQNMPELDKHDRKAAKFSYFDLLEFAEKYAARQQGLAQKLKADIVQYLRLDNVGQANKPYLIYGDKTYTRQEIADEIEGETEFGLHHLFGCVHLASTLIQRDTKGSPQERYQAAVTHLKGISAFDVMVEFLTFQQLEEVKQSLKIAAGITKEKI